MGVVTIILQMTQKNMETMLHQFYMKKLMNSETRLQKQCRLTTSTSARREEATLMIHLMLMKMRVMMKITQISFKYF